MTNLLIQNGFVLTMDDAGTILAPGWVSVEGDRVAEVGAGSPSADLVARAERVIEVRVNAIAPGTILLPDGTGEVKKQWAIDNSLLNCVGTPEDVARTVSFLTESDFVTGAVYFVDGGRALV